MQQRLLPAQLPPLTLLLLSCAFPALAQVVPDAGRTAQELNAPSLSLPKAAPGIDISQPQPASVQPGGEQVALKSVHITGNSLIGEAELLAALGDIRQQKYDFAGLRALTQKISQVYLHAGYPFARAYLPPQALSDGELQIAVLEGRYGQVQASGEAAVASAATPWLADLHGGDPIESQRLERATLILDDQPGIKTQPIIRPGKELGTGDLEVGVVRERRFSADLGLDNHGNRYTGRTRARLNAQWDSPWSFGDQLLLRGLVSDEAMWLGSLSYSRPLGASGLRGQIGYSHTDYQLGKQFSALDAGGKAQITSLGLSYPLLRSQRANANLGATYQHKTLHDSQGATSSRSDKASDSLAMNLSFDRRDSLGGGGITYGTLGWTAGNLHLDSALLAQDRISAGTAGAFQRLNLDLARLQALPQDFSLYARLSTQWANKNLDSSEGFGLGGASGVRAYPSGEGYGDEGWLTQFELRRTMGAVTPFVFYDAGSVRIKASPWAAGNNRRSIAGAGAGVRWQAGSWNTEATLAWRVRGGAAQSDTAQRNPQLWLSAGYRF